MFEGTIGLVLPNHLLAVGVESIVDDPLGGVLLMVIFEAQVAEALGNGLEPFSFWLVYDFPSSTLQAE